MLPEVLSNGLCSLQEGQDRFVRTVFIDYDARGRILDTRFHNAVIRSRGRLEYVQAQAMIDGEAEAPTPEIGGLLREMAILARVIEARRNEAGMLHLELPEVVLDLDDTGRVRDAHPADDSHTHTIIEMFMVEANEAVARLLDRQRVPFPRRIHPEGGEDVALRLVQLLRTVGLSPAGPLDRRALQDILDRVRGRPAERAVNLAVLKTLSRASYATTREGHFALASDHYCHFTSPIRRYPDLVVHRLLDAWILGTLDPARVDPKAMDTLCDNCTETERRAEDAENKLRDLLVLQLLAGRLGEPFIGVVTGVARAGAFVRSAQFGIEGMIRLETLGGDWWEADPRAGLVTGTGTGATLRLGDPVVCRIARVDLEARRLDLTLEEGGRPGRAKGRRGPTSAQSSRRSEPPRTRRGPDRNSRKVHGKPKANHRRR
jgi:ribonuclease R